MPLVPSLTYTEHPLMPGRPMFRCDRMASTLQSATCATMWATANLSDAQRKSSGMAAQMAAKRSRDEAERLVACKGCPIGAAHAGKRDPGASALKGLSVCPRCDHTDRRIIAGHVCVCCYNRQREVIVGRNAKGKVPEKHPPLHRRSLALVREDGSSMVLVRDHTLSTTELVVEALRDAPGRVLFGWGMRRAG